VLACLALADVALADAPVLRRSPEMIAAFKEVVARPSESTVRVQADGKDAALGAVVSADGYIVTKGTLLKGKLSCKLKDGRSFDAQFVGLDTKHDLAMIKIGTSGLKAVDWAPSKTAEVGDWVAAPGNGDEAVAVGVVGVATRKPNPNEFLREPPPKGSGYLGVFLSEKPGSATIGRLEPGGPAAKAGLKPGDAVLAVEGRKIPSTERLIAVIKALKSGSTVTLTIKRGDKEQELKVKLGERPMDRGWMQNTMGSELSKRRDVPIMLQHDLVIKPGDCGGPLVNLDGKTVGINIARAGRTESYALPSEAVIALLADLKSGKLAPPKGNDPAKIAQLEMDLEAAEAALAVAKKALETAEKDGSLLRVRRLRQEVKEAEDAVKKIKKQLAEPRDDSKKK
jgi:serine protease Do